MLSNDYKKFEEEKFKRYIDKFFNKISKNNDLLCEIKNNMFTEFIQLDNEWNNLVIKYSNSKPFDIDNYCKDFDELKLLSEKFKNQVIFIISNFFENEKNISDFEKLEEQLRVINDKKKKIIEKYQKAKSKKTMNKLEKQKEMIDNNIQKLNSELNILKFKILKNELDNQKFKIKNEKETEKTKNIELKNKFEQVVKFEIKSGRIDIKNQPTTSEYKPSSPKI